MKQLSLKAKLTLLYSVIMVVIFSITLGILFYFSSNEILTSTRSMLEERVSSSFDSVEYRNDRLEYDNDLLEIQDGVYLSVYDRDGQMLYGKIPYDFDASLPVEEGNVRRIDTDGVDFFVPKTMAPCRCAASSPSRTRSPASASSCSWRSSCSRC